MKTLITLASVLFAVTAVGQSLPEARCNESVFKPCVCSGQVPDTIKYRPSVRQCGGRAAVILEGEFASSFSVVLRDRLNRDRFPAAGFNGCTAAEANSVSPRAECSAYKCQKVIRRPGRYTCCFGGSGDSRVLSKASRITIKLRDVPNASTDPLLRVCLNGFNPTRPLN